MIRASHHPAPALSGLAEATAGRFRFRPIERPAHPLANFEGLAPATAQALLAVTHFIEVPKHEMLFWAGDQNLFLGEIVKGSVLLKVSSRNGVDHVLATLGRGDMVAAPRRRTAFTGAETAVDCELALIARSDLERIAAGDPKIDQCLCRAVEGCLEKIVAHQGVVMNPSAMGRVAGFLLNLSENDDHVVDLPFSRTEIAEILGLTIETVSRQLAALKKQGIVDFTYGSKAIALIDRAALRSLA